MKFNKSFLVILALLAVKGFAQQRLTLQDAVKIALENNYAIQISRNDLKIDKNNVSHGNAGFLPSVNATVINNNSILNSSQTQANGNVTERNNARGSSLNYGIALNWTIFDGFGMFARYEQLKEFQKLGEANLQLSVINTVGDIMRNYYELVQQRQQLNALDTAVAISRARVQTAQTRYQIGKAAKLEVLNAQVDYNTDTTNYLRQIELYKISQTSLNQLMGRDVNTPFTVAENFPVDSALSLPTLTQLALKQNPSLRAALVSKRIAELNQKVVRAKRYPIVGLSSGYNFNRSESALGYATLTTGRGFTYGFNASISVFNGFLQKRNERNAEISISSAGLDYERVNQSVMAQLASAYQTYLTNLGLVQLEESNARIASQNLDITLARYRLGSITQVEIREAQLNFVNSTVRLNTARYQAKISEITLKEIAGSIIL